jgi:hypothetical protein
MRNDLVELVVVADRSGSMSNIVDAATSGFKEYVNNQAREDGSAYLTLYTFDDVTERVLDRVDIKDKATIALVDTKTPDWFLPRGMTALYDAMGQAINEVGARLAATPEALRPGKVIVVGITDGAENSSRRISQDKLRAMITEQTSKYKWDFVFIGTNQDALLTARGLGIAPEAALYFSASAKGAEGSYEALSGLTSRARYSSFRGVDISASFNNLERELAVDANDPNAVLATPVVDAQP